jgi:hypothetical protein
MAWIKLHQTLINHPKLYKLSDLLGIEVHSACGILIFLWSWALDYADDGDLSKYSEKQLYDAVRSNSEAAPDLLKNLQEAGFVDENLKIHDWLDYAGEFLRGRYKRKLKNKKSTLKKWSGAGQEQVRSKQGAAPPKSRVEESIEDKSYNNIYTHWNSKKIIVHNHFTDKMKRAINARIAEKTAPDAIIKAIDNYAIVLHSQDHYFSYKWNLADFMKRGLDKFFDNADPFNNFKRSNYGKDKQTTRQLSAKAEPNKYAGLEITSGKEDS